MPATTTSSQTIVQGNAVSDAIAYPGGLSRLPQLLERIDGVRFSLAEIVTQAIDLGEEAERLDLELGELEEFVQARVEINRARERRRVRRRDRRSSNGRVRVLEQRADELTDVLKAIAS